MDKQTIVNALKAYGFSAFKAHEIALDTQKGDWYARAFVDLAMNRVYYRKVYPHQIESNDPEKDGQLAGPPMESELAGGVLIAPVHWSKGGIAWTVRSPKTQTVLWIGQTFEDALAAVVKWEEYGKKVS